MKLAHHLLVLATLLSACKGTESTEVNRPPGDVNGTRKLTLRSSFTENSLPFVWASYQDGDKHGFPSGILISCNGIPIIDSRKNAKNDTGRYLSASSGVYDWKYEGADTTFEVFFPVQPITVIDSLRSRLTDSTRFQSQLNRKDSFTVVYHPMGPCTNLQAFVAANTYLFPKTIFDSVTGKVISIHPETLSIPANSSGSVALAKVVRQAYRTTSISSIFVEDSTIGRAFFFNWR